MADKFIPIDIWGKPPSQRYNPDYWEKPINKELYGDEEGEYWAFAPALPERTPPPAEPSEHKYSYADVVKEIPEAIGNKYKKDFQNTVSTALKAYSAYEGARSAIKANLFDYAASLAKAVESPTTNKLYKHPELEGERTASKFLSNRAGEARDNVKKYNRMAGIPNWVGVGEEMLLDPVNLIPIPAAKGATFMKRALSGAKIGSAANAATSLAQTYARDDMTNRDKAVNVLASAAIGAPVGGLLGGVFGRTIAKAGGQPPVPVNPPPSAPGSASVLNTIGRDLPNDTTSAVNPILPQDLPPSAPSETSVEAVRKFIRERNDELEAGVNPMPKDPDLPPPAPAIDADVEVKGIEEIENLMTGKSKSAPEPEPELPPGSPDGMLKAADTKSEFEKLAEMTRRKRKLPPAKLIDIENLNISKTKKSDLPKEIRDLIEQEEAAAKVTEPASLTHNTEAASPTHNTEATNDLPPEFLAYRARYRELEAQGLSEAEITADPELNRLQGIMFKSAEEKPPPQTRTYRPIPINEGDYDIIPHWTESKIRERAGKKPEAPGEDARSEPSPYNQVTQEYMLGNRALGDQIAEVGGNPAEVSRLREQAYDKTNSKSQEALRHALLEANKDIPTNEFPEDIQALLREFPDYDLVSAAHDKRAELIRTFNDFHLNDAEWAGIRAEGAKYLKKGDYTGVNGIVTSKTPGEALSKILKARKMAEAKTEAKKSRATEPTDADLRAIEAEYDSDIQTLNLGVNPLIGFELAGRVIRRISNIGNLLTRGLDAIGGKIKNAAEKYDVVDAILGLRIRGNKDFMAAWDAKQHAVSQAYAEAEMWQKVMREIGNENAENLHRYIVGDTLTEPISAELRELGEEIRRAIQIRKDDLVSRGILSSETAEEWGVRYLHRTYAPKLFLKRLGKYFNSSKIDTIRPRGKKKVVSANVYRRMLEDGEIGRVSDGYWEASRRPDGKYNLRRDWTEAERTDMGEVRNAAFTVPETLLYMDTMRAADDMLIAVSRSADASPVPLEGYVELRSSNHRSYGRLEGMYVKPEVASEIKAAFKGIFNPENGFFRAYRDILKYWKKTKTVYNPAAHMNNTLGNLSILFFEGYNPGQAERMFVSAAIDIRRMNRADDLIAKRAANTITQQETKELDKLLNNRDVQTARIAKAHGIFGRGQIRDILGHDDTIGGKGVFTRIDRAASSLYQVEDHAARLALFKDLVNNQGWVVSGEKGARKYVLDLFPDYTRPMSKAARVMRDTGIIPFISWFWHTAPALARQLDIRANTPNGRARAGRMLAIMALMTGAHMVTETNPFDLPPSYGWFARLPLGDGTFLKIDRMLPQHAVTPQGIVTSLNEWKTFGLPGSVLGLMNNVDLYRGGKATYNTGARKAYDLGKQAIQTFSPQITNNLYNLGESLVVEQEKRRKHPYFIPRSSPQNLLGLLGLNVSSINMRGYEKEKRKQQLK